MVINGSATILIIFITLLILNASSGSGGAASVLNGIEESATSKTTTAAPLGCHRRLYTYRVTQTDSKGHECWDNVSVMSCWGRCDSSEISDWKFPYKRSYHPVCVHASRAKSFAMLRHCHPEADPDTKRYEYLEALSCHCHTCTSTDTKCEAPNKFRDENSAAVQVLALAGTGPGSDDYEY